MILQPVDPFTGHYVDDSEMSNKVLEYDMVIGLDLTSVLCLIINNKDKIG